MSGKSLIEEAFKKALFLSPIRYIYIIKTYKKIITILSWLGF